MIMGKYMISISLEEKSDKKLENCDIEIRSEFETLYLSGEERKLKICGHIERRVSTRGCC